MLNTNANTPVAALNAILPFPVYENTDSGKIHETLKVLRPGHHQNASYNLTLGTPYDLVSFRFSIAIKWYRQVMNMARWQF